jgi:hypothetical protein
MLCFFIKVKLVLRSCLKELLLKLKDFFTINYYLNNKLNSIACAA